MRQLGEADQFHHRYAYDDDNRLKEVQTSEDGFHWHNEAAYEYLPHGPMNLTVLGEHGVQFLDYYYTLQGWMKGMNSPSLNVTYDPTPYAFAQSIIARDVTGFTLDYYEDDYKPIGRNLAGFQNPVAQGNTDFNGGASDLYNGNIKRMTVGLSEMNTKTQAYAYQYDQLNRIKGMDTWQNLDAATNTWLSTTSVNDYKERVSYDANGNIKTYLRHGTTFNSHPLEMDNMTYQYQNGTNKLTRVEDLVSSANYTEDIDDQGLGINYTYDAIGNLISDAAEGITIDWNLQGKVKKITKPNSIIDYFYDPMGNRIGKAYTENNQTTYTWYVRDAQGNPMATYEQKTVNNEAQLKLIELPIYGSSRLGMLQPNKILENAEPVSTFSIGRKQYEISNHLGNVLTTISDAKQSISDGQGQVAYYNPIIKTQQDYYPFGMLMPERQYVAENNPYPCIPCNEIAEAAKQCFIENGVNCTMANIQANLSQGLINSSFVLEDLYSYCQFAINENEIIWDENANQAALLCPEKNGPYLTQCEGAPSTEQYQNCVPCGQISNALQAYYFENGPLPETFLFSSLGISNGFDNYTTSLAQLQDLCNFTFNLIEVEGETSISIEFEEPNGAGYFLCADETVLPPLSNVCPSIDVVYSELPTDYNGCVPCGAIGAALQANYIELGPFPSAFTLNIPGVFENYVTSLAQLQNLCNFTFQVDGNNAPTIDFAEENGAAYYLCPNETVLPPFTEQITAVSGCLPCQDIEQALQNYYLENGSNAAPPTLNALYGVSPELAELNIDFSTYSTICGFTIDFDSNNLPIATWTNPTPNTSYFCLGTYTKAPDENLAYRYGFNGMEKDDEVKGRGNSYDFGARMYDSRLGRWWSLDPKMLKYPYASPYNFALNNPIVLIDPDGGSVDDSKLIITQKSKTEIQVSGEITVKVAIVNLSGVALNMNMQSLMKEMSEAYSGTVNIQGEIWHDEKGNKLKEPMQAQVFGYVKVNFEITEITNSIDKVKNSDDHIVMIVNQIPSQNVGGEYVKDLAGIALIGGEVSAIESSTLNNGSFKEVLFHELGHNLGLGHKGGTFMSPNVSGNLKSSGSLRGDLALDLIRSRFGNKYWEKEGKPNKQSDNKKEAIKFKKETGIK